ncbi:MAG: GPW/gp25 family protein [Acidobacteriota bacterium]
MQIDYPFRLDELRRTATTGEDEHLRDLIEQVLFTAPGERVNRPDFGSGLMQMIFGAASPTVATSVQGAVQGCLQQWLGDRILVEAVEVESDDSQLRVTVQFTKIRNRERLVTVIEREVET